MCLHGLEFNECTSVSGGMTTMHSSSRMNINWTRGRVILSEGHFGRENTFEQLEVSVVCLSNFSNDNTVSICWQVVAKLNENMLCAEFRHAGSSG